MGPSILAWLSIVFAYPVPIVNWVNPSAIRVQAVGGEELLDRCIKSGIEVRYRYEMRYCRRRSGWFDDCRADRVEIRSIQYEPVNEGYQVIVDRLGDDQDPEKVAYPSLADAMQVVSVIEDVPLEFLFRGELDPQVRTNKDYVGVRIISDCKESFGSRLLDISYLFTFGLVKINRYDSGWIAFKLDSSG